MTRPQSDTARASAPRSFAQRLRRKTGSRLVQGFFRGTSSLFKAMPVSHPRLHGVEVIRDRTYGPRREHGVDIYRPRRRAGPLPIVLYVHGGGFRILSKDTHWVFGTMFARRGYLTFVVDYRLAPAHPFPAAVEDTVTAWRWVLAHAAEFGGDPSRIVIAGESAGANLVTSLALATCTPRPEPWARAAFEAGVVPKGVVASCGVLEVSNIDRFHLKGTLGRFVQDRLEEISADYLGELDDPIALELADPLAWLEKKPVFERPLPPFFAPCGTADILVDDARRLTRVLGELGVSCDAPEYPGGIHAFHAFVWTSLARRCWRDTYGFVSRALGPA